MSSDPLVVIGVMVALGVAMNFLRLWTMLSGNGSRNRAKIARIADSDSHLSFDERIAERMRELEKERSSTAAPATPPQGFGRRQV